MMNGLVEISDVAKETICILNYCNPEFVFKIPNNFLENLRRIAEDSSRIVKLDRNKKLIEQEILGETKELIALIYYSYIATDEQKKKLIKTWNENEVLYQEELRKRYNVDDIFKKKDQVENKQENELEMIIYKKSLFQKLLDKFMRK